MPAAALVIAAGGAARGGPRIVDCEAGFGGAYKLGCWAPIAVTVEEADGQRLEVVAPDNDGVATRFASPPINGQQRQTVKLFTRVGRRDAPIKLVLRSDGNEEISAGHASDFADPEAKPNGYASTDALVVEVNPDSRLVAPTANGSLPGRAVRPAKIPDMRNLPTRWLGYEAAECVLISITNPRVLAGVEADDPRLAALAEWVEMGGRLVIVGAADGEAALGADGALTGFAPGRFDREVEITEAADLERFAESDTRVELRRRATIKVARLDQVAGRIEAYTGSGPRDVPLVVRTRRGLGEVTYVAVDLASGPLADWAGAADLVARACRLRAGERLVIETPSSNKLVSSGYSDLSGALQQRLGSRFAGVATTPMLAIAAAAIAYLALIGPVDYYLLRNVIRRMEATWVTLPIVVVAVGGLAYTLANQRGGSRARVNQIELVDIDVASGRLRGTLWAQAYSPEAARHEVSLATRWAEGTPLAGADGCVTWLGLPGRGVGGLQTPATAYSPLGAEYGQSPALDRLSGLPINIRSSKSLIGRWRCRAPAGVDADLNSPAPGVLKGTLANETGATLTGAWLVHGAWAWRLGDVPNGAVVSIADARAPIKLKTLVRNDFLESMPAAVAVGRLGVDGLLPLMMFGRALGGVSFTALPNRFQGFIDLSDQIREGRAVLVARVQGRCSELLSAGEPWAEPTDEDRVYYRFVLEVGGGQ